MLTDFYISFSAVCLTLLGLRLVVVQTRHAEWRGSPLHRRRSLRSGHGLLIARIDEPARPGNPGSSSGGYRYTISTIGPSGLVQCLIRSHAVAVRHFGKYCLSRLTYWRLPFTVLIGA